MTSGQRLRELINERLTAAAEEIFRHFQTRFLLLLDFYKAFDSTEYPFNLPLFMALWFWGKFSKYYRIYILKKWLRFVTRRYITPIYDQTWSQTGLTHFSLR